MNPVNYRGLHQGWDEEEEEKEEEDEEVSELVGVLSPVNHRGLHQGLDEEEEKEEEEEEVKKKKKSRITNNISCNFITKS